MLNSLLTRVFGSRNERLLRQLQRTVTKINALEPQIKDFSDAELQAIAADLRYVFGSAGDALVRGQEAALNDVLSRRVAPAVQQAPIGLSQPSSSELSTDQGSNGI